MSPSFHSTNRPGLAPALVADWRNFVFLHFAVPPDDLAPHVPYPLDRHDGRAYVSLVSFRLENLRPARWLPAAIGRKLLRPLSDHAFLNVRTYVRGPAGPGIHFIAEWIDNPISRVLGPLTYGLPYCLAAMEHRELPGAGLQRIAVRDRASGQAAHIVLPAQADGPPRAAAPGSLADFLLERYIAYTHRRGVGRWFEVRHPRWLASEFQLARFDLSLFEATYPWFGRATFIGGHLASGFADVGMSAPHAALAVPETAPAAEPATTAEALI